MRPISFLLGLACAAVFPLGAPAAGVRVHFSPQCGGGMAAASATSVSFLPWVEGEPRPVPRPNQVVAFRHPGTGAVMRVPLRLYEGTPRMEYTRNRVVYNYGSDAVEVRFLRDGSVEVIYTSGLWRDP